MQNRTPIAAEDRAPLPEFTPVPRKYRHDGWTPERQRAFVAALADTGSVSRAAAMVNMAQANCYTLRRAPGAESFRRAWEAALDFGVARLKDIAFERAIDGYLVPVFVGERLMGFRRKHNDALLMFCLRHYGQDAGGKRTTINYFSTRAGAVAGTGEVGAEAAAAVAEASTTTVRTVIHGGAAGAGDPAAVQDEAAALLDGFEGAALDARAEAEIGAALLALAERQRALIAAADQGGQEAVAMQIDDPGVELVQLREHDIPYHGPLQMYEGPPADAEPAQRFAGEADWVSAGDDIPEGYLAWIEAAEARGERVPAMPLTPAVSDGVAEVKKRPSWRQARKAKAAEG
jgi:hypothetical protein